MLLYSEKVGTLRKAGTKEEKIAIDGHTTKMFGSLSETFHTLSDRAFYNGHVLYTEDSKLLFSELCTDFSIATYLKMIKQ